MKYFILIFLSASIQAQAQEAKNYFSEEQSYYQIFFDSEIRFEKDESDSFQQQTPFGVSFAYQQYNWSTLLEFSYFDDKTENGNLLVERKHTDWMLHLRKHFWTWSAFNDWDGSAYAGLGLGFYKESINTQIGTSSATDNGDNELEMALTLGADTTYFVSSDFALKLALEARLLSAKDYDPNPEMSVLMRVGVQF